MHDVAVLEPMFSVKDAGVLLGTGERFPRRLVAERRIRYVKLGRHVRIPESALAEYIKNRTVEPVERTVEWKWSA